MQKLIPVFSLCLVFWATVYAQGGNSSLKLTSPAFQNNQSIPVKYTCEGKDINPPLMIEGIPVQTKSLALIMDDPDAPMGTWTHWVVFNIPVKSEITENSIPGTQGYNSFGRENYGGPCPPSGTHRYFHTIYALDAMPTLKEGISKKDLQMAMKGHILGEAQLIGLYQKVNY